MNIRSLVLSILALSLLTIYAIPMNNCNTNCCNNTSYAYIEKFVPGWGVRSWLSVIICFRTKPTEDYLDNFIKYLKNSLQAQLITILKRDNEILFKLKEGSITQNEFQAKLDDANAFFDPIETKKREEKIAQQQQEKAEQERLRKEAARLAEEKRKEEERLKREAEEKHKIEQAKINREKAAEAQRAYDAQQRKVEDEQRQKEEAEPNDCDNYYIITLPQNFYLDHRYQQYLLNEMGQVAGLAGSWPNFTAAIWDQENGVKTFPLNDRNSCATSINDKGYACIKYDLENNPLQEKKYQTILWNTNTNHFILGPMGIPLLINNNNMILIDDKTWNPSENTINFINDSANRYIDDNDNRYSGNIPQNGVIDFNKKGTMLCYCALTGGLSLYLNKKHFLVSFSEIVNHAKLNNNNEVVAIVKDKIFKQHADRTISFFKPFKYIKELKNCINIAICGFNSKGMILLDASDNITKTYKTFLLCPKK